MDGVFYVLNNKLKLSIFIIAVLSLGLGIGINIYDAAVININFEDFPLSSEQPLSRAVFADAGVETSNWDNNLTENGAIKESEDGNRYLSIFSPAGGFGPHKSGIQTEIKLNPGKEYYMSYDFMFEKNFSFGSEYRGGKLPGITAGNRCSNKCDGTDGFAARFMWRRDGEAELYLCSVDTKSDYCEDVYLTDPQTNANFVFNTGQVYNIEEYVKLNSGPNNYDGEIRVMIDGVEVLDLEGIRLVTDEDLIDTFYLSMFYGGNSSKWRAGRDSYFYMDNIYLRKLS